MLTFDFYLHLFHYLFTKHCANDYVFFNVHIAGFLFAMGGMYMTFQVGFKQCTNDMYSLQVS